MASGRTENARSVPIGYAVERKRSFPPYTFAITTFVLGSLVTYATFFVDPRSVFPMFALTCMASITAHIRFDMPPRPSPTDIQYRSRTGRIEGDVFLVEGRHIPKSEFVDAREYVENDQTVLVLEAEDRYRDTRILIAKDSGPSDDPNGVSERDYRAVREWAGDLFEPEDDCWGV